MTQKGRRDGPDGKSTHDLLGDSRLGLEERAGIMSRRPFASTGSLHSISNRGKLHGNTAMSHLFGLYGHEQDEYDRFDRSQRKDMVSHKSKNLGDPFRLNHPGRTHFYNNQEIYSGMGGSQGDLRFKFPAEFKGKPIWKPSNPAKFGYNKTLNRFPEYKEDYPIDDIKVIQKEGYWM